MSRPPSSFDKAPTWLEKRLAALDALYHRFGRDGLKDQPIAEVGLLLSAKELQFRDTVRGRDLSDEQGTANRKLELEIKDLRAFLKGQLGVVHLSDLRFPQSQERRHQDDRHRNGRNEKRDYGPER